MEKKSSRIKRALKIRSKIRKQEVNRLTIHRTSQHIYAQVLSTDGKSTLAAASTVQDNLRTTLNNTSNINAAIEVGKSIAERALAAGVTEVAFDR